MVDDYESNFRKFKGRPLKAVPGSGTRPTTDKVKESIFQYDWVLILKEEQDLIFLQEAAASGIEALSSGLDRSYSWIGIKRHFKTIKSNLTELALGDQSEVYRNEAVEGVKGDDQKGNVI